ncbi:hypothetical protein OIU79_019219 [Salix purpurea]|uniref:Uncharacterized protein n=1 Tax=Salix purpurea TaxID=77065 RepID=A0A9Q0SJK7_SALPP|nr:hypothetical protein OIU79_019219 [Salix purpurea]
MAVTSLQINPFTRDPEFNRLLASLITIQTDLVLTQTSDKSIIKSANNASDYNFTNCTRKSYKVSKPLGKAAHSVNSNYNISYLDVHLKI